MISVTATPTTVATRPHRRRFRWTFAFLGVAAVGAALWAALGGWSRPVTGQKQGGERSDGRRGAVTVETVFPKKGGIDRVSVQPGTIEPVESANLYAEVSGVLIRTLDIGVRVTDGQELAKIAVPEIDRQVERDEATLKQATAKLKQVEASLVAAKAEARAAAQLVVQAGVEVNSRTSFRSFRGKQLDRLRQLQRDNAIEARLVDEETDRYEAAVQAENSAREAVTTARLKSEAAEAKITQVEADIDSAKAEIEVCAAELARSRVRQGFATINAPYDGVITRRNFYRGDFVRSAAGGSDRTPLLSIDRTDKMKMVVQIPDRDVPYVDVGDKAQIRIDALPGVKIVGAISRFAQAEDPQTRTMRTEIDIPNTDGLLRRNMYGRVTLTLQTGSPNAVRVPTAAVVGRDERGRGLVRVARDGRARVLHVDLGTDDGVETEVLTGLKPDDAVIIRASGAVEEGTEVN